MSGPTPGPWVVCDPFSPEGSIGRTYGIDAADGTAVVWFGDTEEDGIPRLEDAHLIAAAPELLAALQRWLALDGSAWHADRHAAEKATLIAETAALIGKAGGAT